MPTNENLTFSDAEEQPKTTTSAPPQQGGVDLFGTDLKFSDAPDDEGAKSGSGKTPSLVGAPSPKQWETPEFLTTDREEPHDMPFGEVFSKAIENAPKSAVEFGKSLATPFLEPAQTWEGVKQLGKGVASKVAGYLGAEQNAEEKAQTEAVADAMGQHLAERYGSIPAIKRTAAEDPIGAFADLSSILTLGGSGAARLPGVLGKVGEVAQTAGRAVDPINAVMQAPKLTASIVSKPVNFGLWLQSGRSMESLNNATRAGLSGNPTFVKHMSGEGTLSEMVDSVRKAISDAAAERSLEYKTKMGQLNGGPALQYNLVDNALKDAKEMAAPAGQILDPTSTRVRVYNELQGMLDNWKNNASYKHDIYTFDQLKQQLRNYARKSEIASDPTANKMVQDIANAAKQTVVNADERYANIMERYASQTKKLNEFTYELANGKTDGAKFRKIMNSADSPYKKGLIAELAHYNPDIPYMIAGQELRAVWPQGLRGWLGSVASSGGLSGLIMHPAGAAALVLGSPRVAGNVAYHTGQMGALGERMYRGLPQMTMPLAYQTGVSERLDRGNEEAHGGRIGRATGGKVTGSIAQRLVAAAEKAHKYHQKTTEEILDAPDETVVKALAVAKKNI